MTQLGVKANKSVLNNVRAILGKRHSNEELKCSGIYAIVNIINGHIYVGQSYSLLIRKRQHLHSLEKGNHANPYLQNAYNCYGGYNFKFVMLEAVGPEFLNEREQYWIERLDSVYNIQRNVFEFGRNMLCREELPDGYFQIEEESFIRPEWHKWVYGGVRESRKARKYDKNNK